MNKCKPLQDYKELSFVKFGAFATRIATNMRKHDIFKDGLPTIDLLDEQLLVFMPMSDVQRLDSLQSTQRDNLKTEMVVNLDDLNSLTDYVAKGRKEIILLAGFNPSKEENSSLPPVQEITGLTVNYTTALGIFKIGVKRQEQAYEYIFKWVFENPVDLVEVVWNEYTSHKANFEVNVGRTSGTIWFMVELRDKEGDVAQTPIYSKVIAKLGL